ncbi:hypothetical protein D3C85_1752280 [compost metagenome]
MGQREGVAMGARELVDAVQVRRQRYLGLRGQHVGLQVHGQRLGQLGLERAGRNRVAGMGQDRGGDQQGVVAHAVDF